MGRIGPIGVWELLIILVVVLLIFGPRRLPEMAKGIGQSVREFRRGLRDMKNDFESEASDDKVSKSEAPVSEARVSEAPVSEATVTETPTEGKSS